MKFLKTFDAHISESSSSDFMMSYGADLKDCIKKLKEIGKIPEDKMTDDIYGKLEDKLEVYDKNVQRSIDHWVSIADRGLDVDMIVSLGLDNQNRYGTEPQMIISAIEDYYNVLKRAGLIGEED